MRDANFSLFDEPEFMPGETRPSTDLVIRVGRGKTLSRDQKTFNRLTKRIENLQREIDERRTFLNNLLEEYGKQLRPAQCGYAEKQIQLAHFLSASAKRYRYGKRQIEDVRDTILDLCDQAFAVIEPDGDTIAMYDSWSETTYQEEIEEQTQDVKEMFAEQIREMFGIEIDLSGIDDSPEGFARFMKEFESNWQNVEPPGRKTKSPRKKTAKQLEREQREKREEEIRKKTVRSIYLSLAKVLHPDAISDPEQRANREEFMKQVTAAYKENDLPALLKLELQWVSQDTGGFRELPDEKLRVYIQSLKEQVAELEYVKEEMFFDPRYAMVQMFAMYSPARGLSVMAEQATELRTMTKGLGKLLSLWSEQTPKATIMNLVHDYIEEREAEQELAVLYERMIHPYRRR